MRKTQTDEKHYLVFDQICVWVGSKEEFKSDSDNELLGIYDDLEVAESQCDHENARILECWIENL